MADIFISYSSKFRDLTISTAAYLEALGYSVWWDTSLIGGDVYHKVIVAEIKACKAAVVIWSPASIESDWVYSEAARAHRGKKLVPLKTADLNIDDIPAPFDALHNIEFENRSDLLSAVSRFAGLPRITPAIPALEAPPAATKSRGHFNLGWLAFLFGISGLVGSPTGSSGGPSQMASRAVVKDRPPMPVRPGFHSSSERWRNIFINYRHNDAVQARAISIALKKHFGDDAVFMDIDSIPLEMNFDQPIDDAKQNIDAVLVLIGPGWTTAQNAAGNRNAVSQTDWVTLEIAAALKTDRPLIPILIDGAQMPKYDELPYVISGLARRNALSIRPGDFDQGIAALLKTLDAWVRDE